jgi:DeoR family transcriptional regulator of aga operon
MMRIFLSHSSRQKPLVREIRAHLPAFLSTWLDEDQMLFGDDLLSDTKDAIIVDADYLLLFIDDQSAKSAWVRREVEWAIEAERKCGRTFLLPVLLEKCDIESVGGLAFRSRKYLELQDFQEVSVRALGKAIGDALFALVCRDMERLHHPEMRSTFSKIRESDALLHKHAALVHKIVFPHRSGNPVPLEKLLEIVNGQNRDSVHLDEFTEVLSCIVQRNLIPGLSFDGESAFLVEEHAQWKGELNREKKERIGKRAAAIVQNGAKVVLDAGSTMEEIVRILCKKIETRAITRVTIATTSANIADMISDCCVRMGFDDDYSAVTLLVPGGRIRPNTQAIVPLAARHTDLRALAEEVGGFDIGFVGVNGIDAAVGFTTHANAERHNKEDVLTISRERFIVGDSSKVGIVLEERFATFDDDIHLVIDNDCAHEHLQEILARYQEKVILV